MLKDLFQEIHYLKKIKLKYDVAVCMYHDQALIPIKTLYSGNIINITLGLVLFVHRLTMEQH